ncbi:ABC transporter permease [Atopobacter phocae]|uniref:ABC transporter permease n=1 Tax=Atopobacter phocae TaxID=136492 RepID=UPI00046F415C|nr:ABC transporter permease [Atopobacter phocae]
MNKMWFVAKNVFFKNIKSGTYLWMVIAPFFFLIVGSGVGYYISEDMKGTEDATISVVTTDNQLKEQLKEMKQPVIQFDSNIKEAREKLKANEISGYMDLSDPLSPIFYQKTTDDNVNLSNIETILSQKSINDTAKRLNITEEDITQIKSAQVYIKNERINFEKKEANDDITRMIHTGIAYVFAFFLLMFITTYSNIIAQEIASEKGTRIMEVILSSMKASSNLLGKMIGIVMAVMLQIFIYTVLISATYFIPFVNQFIHNNVPDEVINQLLSKQLGFSVLFLIFGIFMYVSLASFLGSLVSRAEDVPKAISVLTIFVILGFYICMYAISNPNSMVVIVASYIPLLSPFIIPFRIASETITAGYVWLSMGLTFLSTVLITIFSVWFYEASVLVYSSGNIFTAFKEALVLKRNNRKN